MVMILFYILQKLHWQKLHIFRSSVTIHHSKAVCVTPISKILAPITLLLTTRNQNVQHWNGLKWQNVHTQFRENWSAVSKIKMWALDTQTQHKNLISLLFSFVKRIRRIITSPFRIKKYSQLVVHLRVCVFARYLVNCKDFMELNNKW